MCLTTSKRIKESKNIMTRHSKKQTVITYGTFDLLHYGHIELLRRAKDLSNGGKLIVALSTDEFNSLKGKSAYFNYSKRLGLLKAIKYVDEVIPEENWEQKKDDVLKHGVDVFVMGHDWKGKFDFLKKSCEVIYLSRTPYVSSTALRDLFKTEPS